MIPASTQYPLPEDSGWTAPEGVEDVILADTISMHRAGFSTIASDGEEVCGSAAAQSAGGLPATTRAWFELLERVSGFEALKTSKLSSSDEYTVFDRNRHEMAVAPRAIVFPESDDPARWCYAKSNGIALHVDWSSACQRAHWELVERDRVLRSWYGEIAPRRLTSSSIDPVIESTSYEWVAYEFPDDDGGPDDFSRGTAVAGVFGFPLIEGVPFALGLAARSDIESATIAARAEALQVLAFLWGEAIPEEPPSGAAGTKPGAMLHLDHYQVRGAHAAVRRWLEGHHLAYADRASSTINREDRADAPSVVGYVDLTPSWLPNLRVAKAVCTSAMPLVFGASPFTEHLPPELRLHPIP